jgi:hypothetical protein
MNINILRSMAVIQPSTVLLIFFLFFFSFSSESIASNPNGKNKDFIAVELIESDPQTNSYISMATETPTNVFITTPENLRVDHMIKLNSFMTIRYPGFQVNGSSEANSIRIRSSEDISVTVNDQDITSLITAEKLSTSYIFSSPPRDLGLSHAVITVTAIYDDTSVTVLNVGAPTNPKFTLNALETGVHNDYVYRPKVYGVQSSKPVAVFSWAYCKVLASCSHIVEQIPPLNQLDTVYIIPPYFDMVVTVIFLVTKENTVVTFRDNSTKDINSDKIEYASVTDKAEVIRSTKPILTSSSAFVQSSEAPSYWTVVPGINQYLPRYITTVPSGYDRNYIAVMIRTSAVAGLRVNRQSIDPSAVVFQDSVFVDDLEYSVIISNVTEGELALESIDDTPFGLMVYGRQGQRGYGFAGNVILH